eukprot:scaffold1717_cov377-Prasinococcus_capsulatus_cf.AAC.6
MPELLARRFWNRASASTLRRRQSGSASALHLLRRSRALILCPVRSAHPAPTQLRYIQTPRTQSMSSKRCVEPTKHWYMRQRPLTPGRAMLAPTTGRGRTEKLTRFLQKMLAPLNYQTKKTGKSWTIRYTD